MKQKNNNTFDKTKTIFVINCVFMVELAYQISYNIIEEYSEGYL